MMKRLTLLLSRELDHARDAVREIARSLSRIEGSDAPVEVALEKAEGPLEKLRELSDQVSRAAAKQPQDAKRLRDMLRAIERLSLESGDPGLHPAVQTFQALCRAINTIETDGQALKWSIDRYSGDFERAISGEPTPPQEEREGQEYRTGDWHLSWTEADNQRNAQVKIRTQEITKPEFVKQVVLPHIFWRPFGIDSPNGNATIVHEIETGRATVSYSFRGSTLAFGKLYSDKAQGEHSFHVLRELWNLGFDRRDQYRVPEPLTYLPTYKLELMRAVEGCQLSTLFDQEDPYFPTYARQAARWLVKLHQTPLRIGRGETLWQSMLFCKTLRRLAKASAAVPERRGDLVEMVDRLCELGRRSFRRVPQVQTHGTFHYEHILVKGPTTSVIDFDKSFPSDPAKDLAEFLSVLRWRSFHLTESVRLAEQPTWAFLEEYLRYLPENSANLALHWGADVLRTFFRQVRHHRQDDSYDAKMQFLRDEFESVLSEKVLTDIGAR